jgi:tetratricopeptide (TPR) repeat protein
MRLKPGLAQPHNNLGNALKAKGQLDAAIVSYRQAILLKPELAVAHNNLGEALERKGLPAEAVTAYRQAIRLKPHYARAFGNLGNALKSMGQLDEAIASYRQAIRLEPELAEWHSNLALKQAYPPRAKMAAGACAGPPIPRGRSNRLVVHRVISTTRPGQIGASILRDQRWAA